MSIVDPTGFAKPLPVPTPVSAPFWAALNEDRIELQRCGACDAWIHYPRTRCPNCGSDRLGWHAVAGTGAIYTFTVARQATAPPFADEVPQLLAVIELDEGVRMVGEVVDVGDDEIEIGMPLRVAWNRVDDELTLPIWRRA